MPRDFISLVAGFSVIPKRLFSVVCGYVFFLSLRHRRHSLRCAARLVGCDESRFSALLSRFDIVALVRELFVAVLRRLLEQSSTGERPVFIIDTTFQQRQSQSLENVHRYFTGTRFVTAHKFINIVLLTAQGPIPVDCIAVYTKKYCRKYAIPYHSEYELAALWIESLAQSALFSAEFLRRSIFLLDAGFDTRRIQRTIRVLGAHFVVALKSLRVISGKNVAEYFRRHRHLAWHTIRLESGSGRKKHRRKYSVRTATNVELRGVGPATVVWSKAHGHAKKPKYLAASDASMSTREIIQYYARRWDIELWHRDMKQNYGYGDCHCRKFAAVEAHVTLSLTAYALRRLCAHPAPTLDDHLRRQDLLRLRPETSRYGGAKRLKNLIDAGLRQLAA